MPTINDPNGTPLRVEDNGFAYAFVAATPLEAHAGGIGNSYSITIEVDTGAITCDFFYLKNLSNKILRIHKIKTKAQVSDTEIQIVVGVTGAPSGGTEIVPVNSLIGSGSLAEVICEQRSSGDMDLTGGDIFDRLFLDTAIIGEQNYDYSGEISLLKNQALVFHAPSDTAGNVNITIYAFFHDKVG